jgi:excisionase family DNA binding protein
MKKVVNMEMLRQARENLKRIAQEHPELTNLSGEAAQRLREGVFNVTVDESKTTFSLEEAGEILGVHSETLRRWIKAGKLKAAKTGKQYRISRIDLQTLWKTMGGDTLLGEK